MQKRARENDQRDIVLYVPDRLLCLRPRHRPRRGAELQFAWNGKSTSGLPRDTAESVYLKTPRRGFPDHGPGEYRPRWRRRAPRCAGRSVRAVPGQLFAEPCEALAGGSVPAAVPDQSVALWRADESR